MIISACKKTPIAALGLSSKQSFTKSKLLFSSIARLALDVFLSSTQKKRVFLLTLVEKDILQAFQYSKNIHSYAINKTPCIFSTRIFCNPNLLLPFPGYEVP
jgi:hypothetical protein